MKINLKFINANVIYLITINVFKLSELVDELFNNNYKSYNSYQKKIDRVSLLNTDRL